MKRIDTPAEKARTSVLVADDLDIERNGLVATLRLDPSIRIIEQMPTVLAEVHGALYSSRPDILILDLDWADDRGSGVLRLLPQLKVEFPQTRIICVTHYADLIPQVQLLGADAAVSKHITTSQMRALVSAISIREPAKPTAEARAQAAGLSLREIEILRLVASDKSDKEIALRLSISVFTVKHHVSALIRKLDAQSRVGAVANGKDKGLL